MSAGFLGSSRLSRDSLFRSAYTLLELMIALGLLGALLGVGWSLIGNYQSAEVRSWNLVHRTNTARLTRSWLQHDLQKILLVSDDNSENSFWGNDSELEFAVRPKLNPVAVFAQYLDAQSRLLNSPVGGGPFLEPASPTTLPSSDRKGILRDDQENSSARDPFQSQRARDLRLVTYRLEEDRGATALLQEDDTQVVRVYTLIRQESLRNASTGAGDDTNTAADESLTIEDLYRTEESELRAPASTTFVAEQRLDRLLNAEFQYFDGKSWSKQWTTAGDQIPTAVALEFDFPTPAQMRKLSIPRPKFDPEKRLNAFEADVDSVLDQEPLARRVEEELIDSPLELAATSKAQMLVIVQMPPVLSLSEQDQGEGLLP